MSAQRATDTGAVPGLFAWMAALVNQIGEENVFIVSKVGHHGERVWANVLHATGFYRQTGVLPRNVKWVRERTGAAGKAPVVAQLQLTHFVDDHADVLVDIKNHVDELREVVPKLYIVPTTSWDNGAQQAVVYQNDEARAQRAAQQHNLNLATGLVTVPIPEVRAR